MAGETLDRVAERRSDAAWVAALLADPRSRLLLVDGERIPVDGESLQLIETQHREQAEPVLLGLDAQGIAMFAA